MTNTPHVDDKPFHYLLILLEAQGEIVQAQSLRSVLLGTWGSALEMVGELGLTIIGIRTQLHPASTQIQIAFDSCLVEVKKVWPEIC